jgi:Ran GTPase-activating protein (RanGAP) involved in mRNA processing and transport
MIDSLKTNREIEEIQLSSFDFNRGMVENLSDFIVNNYNLKKVNLSWSDFVADDLLLLLSKIKPVKHLQEINISTIPIEGPAWLQMITLIRDHIIINNSLIHLDMSWCNIDPDELEILVEGIKKSKSLLSVHLSGNWIPKETLATMMDSLVKPRKMIYQGKQATVSIS